MPKRKHTVTKDNPPAEPGEAHKALGYGNAQGDYSPAQRAAFRETFNAIGACELELAKRKAVLGAAQDEADAAKVRCKQTQEEIDALLKKLRAIDRGNWQDELPGMEAGQGAAECAPLDDVPEELWEKALEHLAACIAKDKGLDANGLSLALFGDRKGEHRPRCEQILARLVAQGRVMLDESDEKHLRYVPAAKGE